jgi:hypothetical protein
MEASQMDKITPKKKKGDTKMEISATQEIIVKLKAVKDQQNLSIPQIKKMVEATGSYPSLTTLRRVFAENSETETNFNYDGTIRPIAQALLATADPSDSDETRTRKEAYLSILHLKDIQIESLHKQVDQLKEELLNRAEEYNRRVAFLRDQIEKKDDRMDKKDDIIDTLLNQFLMCKGCPHAKEETP